MGLSPDQRAHQLLEAYHCGDAHPHRPLQEVIAEAIAAAELEAKRSLLTNILSTITPMLETATNSAQHYANLCGCSGHSYPFGAHRQECYFSRGKRDGVLEVVKAIKELGEK